MSLQKVCLVMLTPALGSYTPAFVTMVCCLLCTLRVCAELEGGLLIHCVVI